MSESVKVKSFQLDMSESVKVKSFQFQSICTQMEREFGKVRKGEEEEHMMTLFTMESNLLKVHRKYASSNSRRLLEAIPIVLFRIKSYLSDVEYDVDKYISEDNNRLVNALLMAFDPFTNDEVMQIVEQGDACDLKDKESLKQFYSEPVMCILRLRESVETWEKKMGSDGYFEFAENTMGQMVSQDDKMNYAVLGVVETKQI